MASASLQKLHNAESQAMPDKRMTLILLSTSAVTIAVLVYLGLHQRSAVTQPSKVAIVETSPRQSAPAIPQVMAGRAPPPATTAPPAATPYDPMEDGLFDDIAPQMRALVDDLHERVRHEKRDPTWASSTEAVLEGNLKGAPFIDRNAPSSVICGSTICEVSGHVMSDISAENSSLAVNAVQGSALIRDDQRTNLDAEANFVIFGQSRSHPRAGSFVRYFKRKS